MGELDVRRLVDFAIWQVTAEAAANDAPEIVTHDFSRVHLGESPEKREG